MKTLTPHQIPYTIRETIPYRLASRIRGLLDWHWRKYAAPSPKYVKQACLIRNGISNATWVETGTYLGSTTRLLSKYASMVYSIEPEPTLFANANSYFENFKNVQILNGTSEDVFPTLLPKIDGDVNFWLDGHFTSDVTFKGVNDTPIVQELKSVAENLSHFKKLTVLVDDVRCFNPKIAEYARYPTVNFLVEWAQSNKFDWHIEHDIFVAKNH